MNKNWKILIHSMTFNRDFGISFILSRLLERFGCKCIIANNANIASIPIKLWNPDAVFFVTPSKAEKLIKSYPNAMPFMCSAEGSVTYHINESKITSDPEFLCKFSRIHLWGEIPRKHLFNIYMKNPGAKEELFDSIFKVVGNMRGDIIKFRRKRNKTGKIKIGFIGSFWLINSTKKDLYLLKHLYDKKDDIYTWEEIFLQIKYLKIMLDIISTLDKDKYEISLRPYPLEKKNLYQDINYIKTNNISINESFDFSTWAGQQDIIIGNGISTTISLLAIAKIPFINLTQLCGSDLKIYSDIVPSQLLTSVSNNTPCNFDDLYYKISHYDKLTFYDESTEHLIHEIYDLKSEGSSILKVALDIVNTLNKNPSKSPMRSILPFRIIRTLDYLNLKYRKFRNRDSIENDYGFFIYDELLARAHEEFDHVIENILKDPENHKLISSSLVNSVKI